MNFNMQKSLWERIILSKKNNRVGSAYLFLGPNGCGKEAIALKLSAYLNCSKEDIDPCGICSSCKKSWIFQHENNHLIVPMPSNKQLSATDKKNTLLIIYNHGSEEDTSTDPCKLKPGFGYTWDGAVVPAILSLHNKKIKEGSL